MAHFERYGFGEHSIDNLMNITQFAEKLTPKEIHDDLICDKLKKVIIDYSTLFYNLKNKFNDEEYYISSAYLLSVLEKDLNDTVRGKNEGDYENWRKTHLAIRGSEHLRANPETLYLAIRMKCPVIDQIVDREKFVEFLKQDYWTSPTGSNHRTVQGVIVRTMMDFMQYCGQKSSETIKEKTMMQV